MMPNIMPPHKIFVILFTILLLQPLVVGATTKGASSSSAITTSSALAVRPSRNELDTDAMYTLLIVHPESLSNEDEAQKLRMKLAAWHFATDMGDTAKKRQILDAPEISAEFMCHLLIEAERKGMDEVENEFNLGEKIHIVVQTQKQKQRMDEYNRKAKRHLEMVDCSQITKCIEMERKVTLHFWYVEFLKVLHQKHYAAILELMPTNEWSFEEFWAEFKLHWKMRSKNAAVNQPGLRKGKEITPLVQHDDGSRPASTSKLVRELRTVILEALCIEDEFERQNELARIKGNILSMVDAYKMPAMNMASLEFTHPFTMLIGINDNNLRVAEYVYKELLNKPSKDTYTETFDIRLTLRILFSHIWTAIFDQKRFASIIEDEEGSDEIIEALMEDNLREFFELAKDLPAYAGAIGQSQMGRAKQLAIKLYKFWNNLTGYQMKYLERNFDSLREHLLWTDHFEMLTRLNEKGIIDSLSDRGEYARLGEFFGGFENIWQNLVAKKAKYSREGKFENDEDLLALFRIDLNENRIIKIVRDNMEYILKEKSPSLQKPKQNELRNLLGYKQARWVIDLLLYLGELDAHFDAIGSDHLVNQWWMAKVEVELFVDSLADRKGKEGLEMPATRMLNWMHLLWHRKCTNTQKEDNLEELVEDLHKYIGKCKKLVEKHANVALLSGLKDELRTLRYKNLKEILESVDNDGRHRFITFCQEFYMDGMSTDLNVKAILEDLVGTKNANEILSVETHKKSDIHITLYLDVLKQEKLVEWKKAEIELLYQFAANSILNHEKNAREHQKHIASIEVRQRTKCLANAVARLKEEARETGGSDTNKWLWQNKIRWIKAADDLSVPLKNYYDNTLFDRVHMISIEQAEHALATFSGYFENTEYFFEMHLDLLLPAIERSEELQNVLKYKIGAVHRLKLLLGSSATGNEEKTGDRLNIQRFWTKMANRKQLDIIRDANYFHNDTDLQSHYKDAILTKKKVESLRHSLCADIFVFMRYIEPKFGINRSKSGANKTSVNYVEQLKLLFRIEYDKLMTMPLDNDERAYRKVEKIAQIHKQIYEILHDFDSTKKPENNKKWSQLLDLFDIDIGHSQLINDRSDHISETSAELQTRHFNVLKELWGFVDEDGGFKKRGKKGSKEMSALIDLGVRRNHWVGKLLASADSDQRKRKALMHFINIEQIKTFFAFMNVRFKEIKYQFSEAQADEFYDAVPIIDDEEEIAHSSDESYHSAIDDTVQPSTGGTSNRWWDEVESPQTAEAEEANDEQNPEDSGQLSDTASSTSSSRSKAQRARRKKKKQQQKEAARNQAGAESSSSSSMTPQRKSKGKETAMNEEEQEWQKMVYFTAPNEKFDEKRLQKLTGEISFYEFLNDNFLQKHFVAFLLKNQNLLEWMEILTIGCYVNEIGKRMDAHREKFEGNHQQLMQIIEMWERDEMNGRLRQKIAYDREGLNALKNDYYRILRHIYNWNDDQGIDENADDLTMDKQMTKRQLLLINLAKASLNFGAEQAIREEQSAIRFLSMFYLPSEESETDNAELARIGWKRWRERKMFEQFEAGFLAPQRMLLEQQAIDANLLLNSAKWRFAITTSQTNEIGKNQIEADQTLLLSKRQIEHEKELTRALAMAVDFGGADTLKLQNNQLRLQEAIKGVEEIVTKIFAPKTTLQISGSHQLGTLTENSEVETILFASWRIKRKRFFGFNAECDSETRGCADTESLYCIFCKNLSVFNLRKSPKAMVPFVSFTYCPHITYARMRQEPNKLPPFQCVHFWMTFVTLRGYGAISRETLENARLLIENFKVDEQEDIYQIAWNDPRAGMIHALSGYQMNRDILAKLVNASMLRAYRIALLALIKWATNHHIYAAVYGFLNDSTLALMLLKVLLKHPNHSAPYLLERFFFHYTKWPWPMPVQLAELSADNQSLTTDKTLGWRVEKEVHQKRNMLGSKVPMLTNDMLLSMAVIKPGLPEKNEAFTVNHSTMAIIREEMERGLSKFHAILQQQQEPNKANWEQLLRPDKPFNMKYTHFIVLHCFAMDEQLSSEFCDNYVMPQLRLQLLYTVERQLGIRRCHVLPDVGKSKREISAKMRKILGTSKFGNSLLKQWLIGIQWDEGKEYYNEEQKAAISKFHNEAQRGFVERFVQDYSNFLLRDKENAISRAKIAQIISNVKLHVEIVEASEIFDWYSGKEVWIEKEEHK